MLLIVMLFFFMSVNKIGKQNIDGVWSNNNSIIFNFLLNEECKITNLFCKNETFIARCVVSSEKSPATLSISKISSGLGSMYGIIDLEDSNTLRVIKFSEKWRTRPIAFEKESDIVLFKKHNIKSK